MCEKEYTAASDGHLEFLRQRIEESYMHSWVIDNMPVVWCYDTVMEGESKRYCNTRFALGCFVSENGRAHESCAMVVSWTTAVGTRDALNTHLVWYFSKLIKFAAGDIAVATVITLVSQ